MYDNARISTDSSLSIDTRIPLEDDVTEPETTGYYRPKNTINTSVVRGVEEVRRSNSQQLPPRQMLLPSPNSTWSKPSYDHLPTPKIIVSPPIDCGDTPLPLRVPSKHRGSMMKAVLLAIFVTLAVILLIVWFISLS